MAKKEAGKKSTYWDKRRLDRYKGNEKYCEQYISKIKSIYTKANNNVNEMLADVYRNYSKDTGLDVQELKRILSTAETKKTFDELKKKGLDKYVKDNYKSRISRLEQIQAQIYAKAKEVYAKEELQQTMCYTGVVNNSYYKTIYDVSQGTGFEYAFSKIDKNQMEAILSERWSGENYSQRIWTNTDILANSISEIIGGSLLSGQGMEKTARQIRERFNVGKYYAERLVRTETNYFDNQADMMAYEELGVNEYVLVATLDSRTSLYCIELDGKHFPYSEIEVGENYPPFHPNCRCTTRGYLGNVEKKLKRIARDDDDNNREIDYTTYREWAKRNEVPLNIQQFANSQLSKTSTVPLDTFEKQLQYIEKNQKKLCEVLNNSVKEDKDICIELQKRNGFNDKPKVVDKSTFDNLSDEEYIKVHRGIHNGEKTAKEYIEQFKYGKNEYGDGQYHYGVGHYSISLKEDANTYGDIIDIAIPKNARIIEYDELYDKHYKNYAKYNNNLEYYYNKYGDDVEQILTNLNDNISTTAIFNNYDAIKKRVKNNNTGVYSDMYIILNRGKIIVKE